ncbi:hypothetical protein BCV70DRAFT_201814 [Testicularia cyperi]|uniref:Acyltransferase 3 domain-containing protein n=1 Tax=Testicularia cyperi TaxID=1882483 RepID=A0A317XL21_9BASI|nr:hypothetical protein BCV70DRAFT_201814 [Testicularia cyperi]
MVKAITFSSLASAALALSSLVLRANAACECGYLDPATQHLWTDAAITYFNETGLEDMVMNPVISPKTEGQLSAGDTGTGQQTWSAVGDHVNPYEESFGAMYLSAVSYNNTYIDNRTLGLAMEVSTANQKTHHVNGSSIVTRRRDILFGSFRASVKPPFVKPIPGQIKGYGSGFKFAVAFNGSENMHVNILSNDYMPNSTLGWSFAASRWDDNPVKTNLTYLQNFTLTNETAFIEHRMEWLNSTVIQYKNNAENESVNFFQYKKDRNAINLPTTPAPVSLEAWANGEPSASQGPPTYEPNVARVMYTRFFFNSSRLERTEQFESQCAAVASSANAICSTEDFTLRDSTPFDLAALDRYILPKGHFTVPFWAVIVETFFLVVLSFTIAHGLYIRSIKEKAKKRKAAKVALKAEEKIQSELDYSEIAEKTNRRRSRYASDFDKSYKQIWAVPELMDDWGSDDESDIDEDDERFWESVDVLRGEDYKEDKEQHEPGLPTFDDSVSPESPRSPRSAGADSAYTAFKYDTPIASPRSNRYSDANGSLSNFSMISPIRPGFQRSTSMREQIGRARQNTFGQQHAPAPERFATINSRLEETEEEAQYPPTRPGLDRYDSYDSDVQVPTSSHDATKTQRYIRDSSSNLSLPYIAPRFNGSHSAANSVSSLLNYSGTYNHAGAAVSSMAIDWEAEPKIIQWNKRKSMGVDATVGQLAQPAMGDKNAARRLSIAVTAAPNSGHSFLTILWRRFYGFFFISGEGMKTAAGDARIDYLDGMRGFACLFVSLGHFILIFYFGIPNNHSAHHYPQFEYWVRVIFGPIIINAGLVLGIFFVLPSRTMGSRYLTKGGLQSLADNSVRRMPRLIIPAAGACLANYMMIDVGAYKWVPRMNSLTWSNWSYFQNFDNMIDFVDSFIALWWAGPPDQPALVTRYATGVLWTIPVIVQGAWTCMLCAVFAHEIKTHWKRYFFYFCCILMSWYAQTWDLYFMSGLVVADLDMVLKYRKWGEKGVPLLPKMYARLLGIPERIRQKLALKGKVLAWAFFLACCVREWLSYIPGAPAENFDKWDVGVHPNFYNSRPNEWNNDVGYKYQRPRTSAWFLVMSVFILADQSPAFRQIFRLKVWSFLGKHSMAFFLLHGIIFWTWGAWLCVTMLTKGISYFATITVTFVTSYILLTLFCIAFTYTFEYWGILASKAMWRMTSGSLGRRA